MNHKDLHKFITGMSATEVSLPLHQRRLRERLLAQHARQQSSIGGVVGAFKTTLSTGVLIVMKKNIALAGVSVVAAGVLAFSLVPQSPASAAQHLVEGGSKKAQQMSPEELARINAQYHQNLLQRLDEAKQTKGARVLKADELAAWGADISKPNSTVKTYVGYTDSKGHKVVIGFNQANDPLFVFDVDAPVPASNYGQPNMEFKTMPAPSAGN